MHRGRAAPAPIDLELIRRLRQSFERIVSAGDRFPDLVFATLFDQSPELRSIFPEDLASVKHRFTRMLNWSMAHFHEPQQLRLALLDLGRRHQDYGVKTERYPAMSNAIVKSMSLICADDWNEELDRDWRQTFELMTHHMLRAYRTARVSDEAS